MRSKRNDFWIKKSDLRYIRMIDNYEIEITAVNCFSINLVIMDWPIFVLFHMANELAL